MAEPALTLRDHPQIIDLISVLEQSGLQKQKEEVQALVGYIDGMEEKLLEKLALREALRHLGEKERLVIQLRYYHSLTQQRVAELIGVSQVQVSRIEKKALERLRTFF